MHGSNTSLRMWLDKPERKIDKSECLYIFSQIAKIVNAAHSQGIVVNNMQPSCFSLSPLNHVSFIEPASYSHMRSDILEDGLLSGDFLRSKHPKNDLPGLDIVEDESVAVKNWCYLEKLMGMKYPYPVEDIFLLEASWYTSPEQVAGAPPSLASDIYCLGVILFELFCPPSSREEKRRTMANLRHLVLPPQLLMEWPKEASLCLLLVHPDPNIRPIISELLQSEFLNQLRRNSEGLDVGGEFRERIEEQEFLLEFLSQVHGRKREAEYKLQDVVSLLSSDIEEVKKHQTLQRENGELCTDFPSAENINGEGHFTKMGLRKQFRIGSPHDHIKESLDDTDGGEDGMFSEGSRMLMNIEKLESAYFMTRYGHKKQLERQDNEQLLESSTSTVITETNIVNDALMKGKCGEGRQSGWIEPFLEGLCKYVAFSKLEVRAELHQGDLLNITNLVCSLSFDRDGEFFAAAGVNKWIKVFECNTVLEEDRDIHYPVVEISSRSKICCVRWNPYIKHQIASSNFEGVVQVWDVRRNEVLMEMMEHEKRVWSIDISTADPMMLASGSDDGSIKLWSINQAPSIATIKTKANICSVKFAPDSGRTIAFGSADHKIYYYDLRNSKFPLCTLIGHNKTVSYVEFLDSMNLVSSSTDNTLKLWDMSISQSRVLNSPLLTFSGHLNMKNFVGLSISNGYIATGSETNEVFVYHKAFPMPALSLKFDALDFHSGHNKDKTAQFVSSVCWRGQSSTLVAANSSGNIKILEMV